MWAALPYKTIDMRLGEIFTHSGKPHHFYADELKRAYEIANSTFLSTSHFIKIMMGEDFEIIGILNEDKRRRSNRYQVCCEVRPLQIIPQKYWFRGFKQKADENKKKH